MTFSELMRMRYNAESYHCGHFTRDAWKCLTGGDIADKMHGLILPLSKVDPSQCDRDSFTRIPTPVSPCIAVLRTENGKAHIGVFIADKIMHITETFPEFASVGVVMRNYSKVTFYAVKDHSCS